MSHKTLLTGVKPTGRPHIGNYFGAIEPTLKLAASYEKVFVFIADYHALNAEQNANNIAEQTKMLAATWLAAGLNPDSIHFYRQSDIPEIFELQTILNAYTPKGWMNKAHAYKAAVDKNTAQSAPADNEINMGLYTYPILMASDILIARTNAVPVGQDQIQHVEIARDIAQRFNHQYKTEVLTLPEYTLTENKAIIPGIDGRKMSKSYDNVIPLFAKHDEWAAAVNKTQTSTNMDETSVQEAPLFKILSVLQTEDESEQLKSALVSGDKQWKDAKAELLETLHAHFADSSNKYFDLLSDQAQIEAVLARGVDAVRAEAQDVLAQVKKTIGIAQ